MLQSEVATVILGALRPFVRERKIEGEPSMEHKLIADLGVDSSRLIEVILDLEDRFGIEIPDGDVSGFHTLGDLINYVTARRAA